MNTLVRLNISKTIGTGHFRRMQNLVHYMSNHSFLFIVHTDNVTNNLFKNKNIIFIEDEEEFYEILKIYKYDVVILDFLHYPNDYIKTLTLFTQKPIVSFHEYKDFSEYSSLTINYNLFDGYKTIELKNKSLLGPDFIIFDDEIVQYSNAIKENYIFVSFGGADPNGLTKKFIDKIATQHPTIKFKIHIGDFNQSIHEEHDNVEYLIKPKNLFKDMSKAKMAVTAGGNMMYEFMFLNVPSIVIAHNTHQAEFARNADNLGLVKYVGLTDSIDVDRINIEIQRMFDDSKLSKKYLIHNEGKKLIATAIEELIS